MTPRGIVAFAPAMQNSGQKTVLVTGATSGLGTAIAAEVAQRGHRVIATGRRMLSRGLAMPRPLAGSIELVDLDVSDSHSIETARKAVHSLTSGAGIDVLINNAGYAEVGPMADLGIDRLRRQFETNVIGLVAVTDAFLPAMLLRGHGRVVNISSLAGRVVLPFGGAYHASMFAVEALSDAMRLELAPLGVDVVVVEPGAMRTQFADTAIAGVRDALRPNSPYAPLLTKSDDLRARFNTGAVSADVVARVIADAALTRRPRPRYVVPKVGFLMIALSRLLPVRWFDAIVRRATGLNERTLATAGASESLDGFSPSIRYRE